MTGVEFGRWDTDRTDEGSAAPVTLFDTIALLILGVSALVGFVRGALREVSTAVAFVIAVAVALLSLRFPGHMARADVHPSWAGDAVALIVVFLAVYVLLRVIAGAMGRGVHATRVLGIADRLVGAGIGLIRGLIVLGLFSLLFNAATPPEQAPTWITQAKLYPLAQAAAKAPAKARAPRAKKAADSDGAPSEQTAAAAAPNAKPAKPKSPKAAAPTGAA